MWMLLASLSGTADVDVTVDDAPPAQPPSPGADSTARALVALPKVTDAVVIVGADEYEVAEAGEEAPASDERDEDVESRVSGPEPDSAVEVAAPRSDWLDEEFDHRGNGASPAATFLRADPRDAPLRITLYLHPGRSRLGVLGLERMRAQFDLAGARVFESMGEAELAADDLVGFLAEVEGGFVDSAGRRRETGVVYLPALKP